MDIMDIKQTKRAEIEQFLLDVRAHFCASLETSEYENTSNLFHVTAAEQTQELLQRCNQLLASYADEQATAAAAATTTAAAAATTSASTTTSNIVQVPITVIKSNGDETGCYQEMLPTSSTTAAAAAAAAATTSKSSSRNSLSASREYVDLSSNLSLNSDKTFRCSQQQQQPLEPPQQQQDDQQLYDICQHQQQQQQQGEDETQQVFAHELFINCPYADLPAGHLTLQRSIKYGQLHRIEKRLFFDQTKKYYCGILNDWMLCYADGPTACRPSSSLYLKSSAIEIEHFGEGKRRDICFQITTADPGKKFVYQANNEVDAKEWIHAIEAAIRGDASAGALSLKMLRKLPTPPISRKLINNNSYAAAPQSDSIYEEPSPIYNFETPPRLPDKSNSPSALAKRFDYDIPKYQPLIAEVEERMNGGGGGVGGVEVETVELLNGNTALGELKPQPSSLHGSLAGLDFQAKVKTVHSELSSQLTSPERLKKAVKKSYSSSSNGGGGETEMLSPSPAATPIAIVKDQQKKQRKSATQQSSPQTTPSKDCDKLARNWFLSRLNKSTSSTRSTNSVSSNATATPANAKCKQSEKENLLNGNDLCDGNDQQQQQQQQHQQQQQQQQQFSSNPSSPCLKAEAKSKVNMIINQFESSGHLSTMFSVETLAANALASLTSFCERETDNCNNYEPIVPLSPPPSSFLKKV